MKKIIWGLIVLLLIAGDYLFSSLDPKNPLLIIDEESTKFPNHLFFEWIKTPLEGKLADDGSILFTEYQGGVVRIDRQSGRATKFDKLGQGPGELNFPNSIALVEDQVWVVSLFNSRIEILDRELKQAQTFSEKLAVKPSAIAVNGSGVIAVKGGITGKLESEILFINQNGKILNWIKVEIPKKFENYMSLWHNFFLRSLGKDKFMLVFKYLPLVIVIDINQQRVNTYYIDKYIKAFDVFKESPNAPPPGFGVVDASQGPDNTILLAVCQPLPKRVCNILVQLNEDCSKKFQEFEFDLHIRALDYNIKRRELLVILYEKAVVYKW